MRTMIQVCCCLWDANEKSFPFSRHYNETDVEKLYRGFKRHMTGQWAFFCFVDREREFLEPAINQRRLSSPSPGYEACLEPLDGRLGALDPIILVGLDTVVTGDLTPLCQHLERAERVAVPRDPFFPETVCNGVILAPKGWTPRELPQEGEAHDPSGIAGADLMAFRRGYEAGMVDVLDDILPGLVVSYKGHVKAHGLGDARVVYFHGQEKPHQVAWKEPWLGEHWI